MSGICSAHQGHDRDCPRCRISWIAEETRLFNRMMDPATYRGLLNKDGEPASENQKVSFSWKLYKKWFEHGT